MLKVSPEWVFIDTGQKGEGILDIKEFVDLANHDYRLANHGQAALTASSSGGPVGCYITGNEEIGLRASPGF